MKSFFRQPVLVWLSLGLLIRLCLVYFQYSGDVGNHLVWGRGALEKLPSFYTRTFPGFNNPNYPPVTIFLFSFSVWLYQSVQNSFLFLNQSIPLFPSKVIPLMETLNMQSAFLKLPAILADIGIGWLIFKLAPIKKESYKLLAASLYLFNPAVIYISTVWGQIESVPIFFILLSIYFQFHVPKKYYYFLSHISFTLAILSKQTALWLLPVFVVLWLKNQTVKTFLQAVFLQVVIFLALYLPFTFSLVEPFKLYLQTLAGSSSLVSDAAWNIWHFIYPTGTPDTTSLLFNQSVRSLSILLLFSSVVFVTFKYLKENLTLHQALFWVSMVAFFFQTRVHERHLFPALVFLILAFKPSISKTIGFLGLTLFHLFNLYWTLNLPFI